MMCFSKKPLSGITKIDAHVKMHERELWKQFFLPPLFHTENAYLKCIVLKYSINAPRSTSCRRAATIIDYLISNVLFYGHSWFQSITWSCFLTRLFIYIFIREISLVFPLSLCTLQFRHTLCLWPLRSKLYKIDPQR